MVEAGCTISHQRKFVLTSLCIAAYLVQNLAAALLGPLLPLLGERLRSDTATLAILVPTFNAGSAIGSGAAGRVLDWMVAQAVEVEAGVVLRRPMRLLASLLFGVAVCHALLGLASGFYTAAGAVAAHGICDGASRTSSSWLMLRLHAPESVAPYMQAMHLASGVGRFLSGLLGGLRILQQTRLHWAFLLGSCPSLVVAALLACASRGGGGSAHADKAHDSKDVGTQQANHLKGEGHACSEGHSCEGRGGGGRDIAASEWVRRCGSWQVWLMATNVLLLAGVHHCMQYLLPAYAVAHTPPLGFQSASEAAGLTATYSFAYAAGRFVSIPLASRLPSQVMLWTSVLAALASLLVAVTLPASPRALHTAAAALALALSPAHASAISFCRGRLGDTMSGGSISLLMLATTAGGVVLPHMASSRLAPAVGKAQPGLLQLSWTGAPPFLCLQLWATILAGLALGAAALVAPPLALGNAQARAHGGDQKRV